MKQIERFLGLTGYFRKFVPDYALIAKPLNDLKRKNVKFEFDTQQQLAFEKLKEIITTRPVLAMHRYGVETEVHTDASKNGLAQFYYNEATTTMKCIQYDIGVEKQQTTSKNG